MRRNVWANTSASRSKPPHGSAALGLGGEEIAARYLVSSGCRILARRWRGGGPSSEEIDLVVQEGGEVVFVEVKARRGCAYGHPEEAVTAAKCVRLRRAVQRFLSVSGLAGAAYRIDVIAVNWPAAGGRIALRHIRSAVGEED